jgi:6,7-dimethyl-8-ribityllumazine synthase
MKIGIVASQYNRSITDRLLDSCLRRLAELGVPKSSIAVVRVPGTLELPVATLALASQKRFDALICLGCVLQGQTNHHTIIAQGAAQGIQQVSLQYKLPIVFGVITPGTHKQALARSSGKSLNRGIEAAETAIKMVKVMRTLPHPSFGHPLPQGRGNKRPSPSREKEWG